jgi:hypothetical protein
MDPRPVGPHMMDCPSSLAHLRIRRFGVSHHTSPLFSPEGEWIQRVCSQASGLPTHEAAQVFEAIPWVDAETSPGLVHVRLCPSKFNCMLAWKMIIAGPATNLGLMLHAL